MSKTLKRPSARLRTSSDTQPVDKVTWTESKTDSLSEYMVKKHEDIGSVAHELLIVDAQPDGRPEHLTGVRFVRPSRLALSFADGLSGVWSFADLGLDMANMKPESVAAKQTSMTVMSKWGDLVEIDAASLRAEIDPAYRAEVESALLAIRGPIDALPVVAKTQR